MRFNTIYWSFASGLLFWTTLYIRWFVCQRYAERMTDRTAWPYILRGRVRLEGWPPNSSTRRVFT